MRIKNSGHEKLVDNSGLVEQELEKKVAQALEGIGLKAQGYAIVKCPVRSGRLHDSITHVVDDHSVTIGSDVEYAAYVELGTSRQSAEPYLYPALEDHIGEYKDFIEKTLKSQ